MAQFYEVFDNSEVQYLTRRQVATLTGVAIGTALASMAAYEVGIRLDAPMWTIGSSIALVWMGAFWWILHRLGKLRRVVWCVKLSDRRIVGYDYARRKTELDWIRIERIILAPKGLIIDGAQPRSIEIPHLFPEFATLSHRIFEYANLYDIPVFINGQPWQQLDVYAMFPTLLSKTSADELGN